MNDTATNPHEAYMHLAIQEAIKAKSEGNWPFGAVVVQNGLVVGAGYCKDKTTGDVTDHAEIIALRTACRTLKTNNLSGTIIYCTNEPCLMCSASIFQANISHVIIGVSRDDLPHLLRQRNLRIDDIAKDSGRSIEMVRGVLKEEILKQFVDIRK